MKAALRPYFARLIGLTAGGIIIGITLLAFSSSVRAQSDPALAGEITDVKGARIDEAKVVLVSSDRIQQKAGTEHGEFSFGLQPPGRYKLEVTRFGFKPKSIDYLWDARSTSIPLRIVLDVENTGNCDQQYSVAYEGDRRTGGPQLSVASLDPHNPLPQSTITVTKRGQSGAKLSQVADASGKTNFSNLESGEYLVKVVRRGYHDFPAKSFWVARNSTTTVTVHMVAKGTFNVCQ